MEKTCSTCVSYLTDEDAEGNLAEFHHDKAKPLGFCALRDLFYEVQAETKACAEYVFDGE